MSTGLEATLARTAGRVVSSLVHGARAEVRVRRLRDCARPLIAQETATGLLDELSSGEAAAVAGYLASPDFEQVALQVVIARMPGRASVREEHLSAAREQIRHGLRLAAAVPGERLLGLTDVVLDALLAAAGPHVTAGTAPPEVLVAEGHVAAAGARNGVLLGRLTGLGRTHAEVARLRSQVAHLHADMRMPHNGKVRSVSWDRLHVAPALHLDSREAATVGFDELTEPGQRHVILGDPGAGKSTLAAKLAYDLAADNDGTVVPLLVVLRHFSAALQAGERTLAEHLIAVGKDPYNIVLTPDMVDYLLMNGRAVVILDGLDELTDVALRRRVSDLVKGFALLHPLVPVVVTSRRVGYAEAGLDPELFRTCALAPFDTERVAAYVRRWFQLDDGSAPAERDRLATAFLTESESIEDLRSSPLLLSVLCAMYAADHFIPRNRGQVYERCALMVFEQWDQLRGISRALGFEGRVRSAVQELAWTLLTEHPSPEQPRHRIKRILEQHLIGKGFDEDQAAAVAVEFLDYCSGRAWILAEIGSTSTEPIFGFAHRTFLEYFAAEHLVRRSGTPEQVWERLAPQVRANQWEVVAQLALQLIDRNVDDGGDALLRLALHDAQRASESERAALIAFCARSLGDVCVSPEVVRRIVEAAVDWACALGEADRFQAMPLSDWFAVLTAADGPLYAVLYRSLPGNLPFVRRSLAEAFGVRLDGGDDIAAFLVSNLSRCLLTEDETRRALWSGLQHELEERHRPAYDRWRRRRPWAWLRDDDAAAAVLAGHGVLPFYVADLALSGSGYPWVVALLVNNLAVPADDPRPLTEAAHLLRDQLLRQPTPWLPWIEPNYSFTVERIDQEPMPTAGEDLATRLVLFLPYVEYGIVWLTSQTSLVDLLARSRDGEAFARQGLERELTERAIPRHVSTFLMRWADRKVDLVGGPSGEVLRSAR
ncbi:hypothetical protein Ais01nite_05430 [Asanoa ishikariensis]|uniref:NACHT domain-containing protein n=1 Tax=Asanoa ishikariensis TaxID=137265 RepID=A0A1H3TFU4_9ACTN|nr:NACHT domain-containing protein [Asanoa ishikariensis]GIF62508.1 hypothetical protein Ais01nite_05430 [Asanoa ishikariensis]SDZ49142.1 NACHT domain-containing protein [Asanoa ishikariensis]